MLRKTPALLSVFLVSLALAHSVKADWTIDNEHSRLSFVSTKANTVAEVHHFGELEGWLGSDGRFRLTILLASVETGIPIRNERMRELFFDTAEFPTAGLTASLDMTPLLSLEVGDQTSVVAEAQLKLLGNSTDLTIEAVVARLDASTLLVNSAQPIVVDADTLGLAQGVEQLREIAGLPSISPAVPVSFRLTLREDDVTGSTISRR